MTVPRSQGGSMNIGIFGGSFDPIHVGHTHTALLFKKLLQLDRVLLLPAFAPFYKETCQTPYAHRLAMCRLAAEGAEGVEASDLERSMPKSSFTCDVVREMKKRYPGHTFFLLLGGDAFARMPHWKGVDEIIETLIIGVVQRGETKVRADACRKVEMELRRRGGDIRIFDAPILPISSSMIRAKAARGEPIRAFVPPSVADHIQQYALYERALHTSCKTPATAEARSLSVLG